MAVLRTTRANPRGGHDARMKPLEDFIDGFHSDFGLLNQALKKDGFGPKATGAASGLWAVFVRWSEHGSKKVG